LFAPIDEMLNAAGFSASGGRIIDATFVEVPRQRNSRDDNEKIKNGEGPDDWSDRKKAHKVTDASVHDSRELDNILDPNNDSDDLWADSAYRSNAQDARLKEKGYTSHIHERAYRNTPLTPEQEAANTERSRVRVRVEHIFGPIETQTGQSAALWPRPSRLGPLRQNHMRILTAML
jgi:transposase, IS5 family